MAKLTVLASFLGAVATALWGAELGGAVQGLVIATAGVVSAVAIHEHHATVRNANNAAVAVGGHESVARAVESAVASAVPSLLPAIAALAHPAEGVPSAPSPVPQPPATSVSS